MGERKYVAILSFSGRRLRRSASRSARRGAGGPMNAWRGGVVRSARPRPFYPWSSHPGVYQTGPRAARSGVWFLG